MTFQAAAFTWLCPPSMRPLLPPCAGESIVMPTDFHAEHGNRESGLELNGAPTSRAIEAC